MPKPLLEHVKSPADIQGFSQKQLLLLAEEMRQRIIDVVSKNGGHLGSNLGMVELTIALHYVFSSPIDQLIFDTSHQSYPHKLLTGRNAVFETLGKYKGIAGFCEPHESEHDHFFAGHAGTALSLALGVAKARDVAQEEHYVLPIIGDASLTCGLTLEALNNIPKDLKKFIIVLNDNTMSISNNVGAITNILSRIVNSPKSNRFYQELEHLLGKFPLCGEALAKQGHKLTHLLKNLVGSAHFFEQFGLTYVGPVDGHDIKKLILALKSVKTFDHPILLHVLTTKGKGMETATQNPITYHGCNPFDKETGQFITASKSMTFPKIFGEYVLKKGETEKNLVVITPAMLFGSSLDPFMEKFPERCVDVGIAEGHSVTFCGGIASNKNVKVICAIYGTFLQRAFDNLFQDVCLQRLPVIFAIDRAGLAAYGPHHHAIYDIAFLNAMPHLTICQPRNGILLKQLLESALTWDGPTAIRYPNLPTADGAIPSELKAIGEGEVLSFGKQIAIFAVGAMCDTALEIKALLEKEEIYPTIIDPIFIKPIDERLFSQVIESHEMIITLEEHTLHGGFASIFDQFLVKKRYFNKPVLNFAVPDRFLSHGSRKELLKEIKLDPESVAQQILKQYELLKNESLLSHDHSTIS